LLETTPCNFERPWYFAKDTLSGVRNVLGDDGYSRANFVNASAKILGCTLGIIKRNELHRFVMLPKKWIVEKSFLWLEKCRRL
jgi:transposase